MYKYFLREPFALPYALCRSILALSLLLTLLFSDVESIFPQFFYDIYKKDEFILSRVNLFHLFGYERVVCAKIISIIILVFVISGYYPRITGILHFWVTYSFFYSCFILEGGDQVMLIITLLFIPLTLLDNRKNHFQQIDIKNDMIKIICNSIFLLIFIQIAVIYLQAGVEKLYKTEEWRNGTAIYYWLNHNTFGISGNVQRFFNYLLSFPLIVTTVTWSVIVLEITIPFAFFFNKQIKRVILAIGIFFHLMIAFIHGIPGFSLIMIGVLLLYLGYDYKINLKFEL